MPETENTIQEDGGGERLNGQVTNETEQANRQEPQRGSFFDFAKGLILRALFIFFITSYFRRSTPVDPRGTQPHRTAASNSFENGTAMDLFVFMSEKMDYIKNDPSNQLIWHREGLTYGDWIGGDNGDGTFSKEISFKPSHALKNNGSIYLHVFLVKQDESFDGRNDFPGVHSPYATKQLNKYKKLKFTKTQNLLTGQSELSPEDIERAEKTNRAILSHWHPNITLNIVVDFTNWVSGSIPSPIDQFVHFNEEKNQYNPILYVNDFWNLQRDYEPINDTVDVLKLRLTFQPLTLFKWQMYAVLSLRSTFTPSLFQEASSEQDDDQDFMKETLLETSPYLLAATIVVTLLHSVFELLAFKNDIQFWKERKSLEGLSVRLVFFNVFQSLIVLLFVFDNDTNTVVRLSCFFGLAIDIWKINKVVDISLDRENKLFNIFPRVKFADKGSYVESSTKEYDELAFKYLSWVLFPLLFLYVIYSLVYQEHKGWYSWLLNMIFGFLLTFGFITMTPQLFINYKLKSVAHLPWRMMTYKCLNTFIDDVFAFVIKMPTMYRLGCFRDDVVFFIMLYQRWIYKTDPTRVNEFGFSGEMEKNQNNDSNSVGNEVQKSIEDKKTD